jgi:DNA-binding CsgD family transcriptional regulator
MESVVTASSATDPELFRAGLADDASVTLLQLAALSSAPAPSGSSPQLNALRMEALDAVVYPVLAVLGNGRLVFANLAGRAALEADQWIRQRNGQIDAASHLCNPQEVRNALAEIRRGRPITVVLVDSATGVQAVLAAAPSNQVNVAGIRAGFIWLIPTTVAVTPVRPLARVFGLSIAEKRFLEQLVASENVGDAASRLHISVHTARNHLKMIFHKTGRRTQGQLLAFANRMASLRFPKDC